jgi:signal peptidase I
MGSYREILETILIAVIIALVMRGFVVETYIIDGPCMEPNLWTGERVLVNKLAGRFGNIDRGDVIVFRCPYNPSEDYIKRVVAVGGDSVELRLGRLYVNGQLQEEPYTHYPGLYTVRPVTVPESSVYVLGDNRVNSEDSRVFGSVSLDLVKGKAFLVIWPPKKIKLIA